MPERYDLRELRLLRPPPEDQRIHIAPAPDIDDLNYDPDSARAICDAMENDCRTLRLLAIIVVTAIVGVIIIIGFIVWKLWRP